MGQEIIFNLVKVSLFNGFNSENLIFFLFCKNTAASRKIEEMICMQTTMLSEWHSSVRVVVLRVYVFIHCWTECQWKGELIHLQWSETCGSAGNIWKFLTVERHKVLNSLHRKNWEKQAPCNTHKPIYQVSVPHLLFEWTPDWSFVLKFPKYRSFPKLILWN